jgi:uncharacterized protein GlcG (DUF336 family)
MTLLTLTEAQAIAGGVLARGRELNLEPLTVTVLDASGTTKALAREDGSSLIRPDIAHAKAWSALGMGLPTRELARRQELMPAFFTSLAAVSQGRMVAVPGGVLILRDGQLIGAVGVTGDTSDNDEICAVAGVAAAGLESDAEATPKIRQSEF